MKKILVLLVMFLTILSMLLENGCQKKEALEETVPTPPSKTTSTIAPKPAFFECSNLTITPGEIEAGSSVTIEITVSNTGEQFGTYEVKLKIDDVAEDTERVALEGGASQRVAFQKSLSIAKTYSISIEGQSGILLVTAPPEEEAVTISWEEAANHIDETLTVCGPIIDSTPYDDDATLLGMGASIWAADCVGIELYVDLAGLPEDLYVGQTICVTGTNHLNPLGGASISVEDVSQITVQAPPEEEEAPPVQPIVPSGVSVTFDAGCSASAPVSGQGAVLSVTAEGGTGSTLTVPALALLNEETITLTPISDMGGIPIKGTFLGGIHMAPEGLQFSTPCTLEIELPADVGAVRLVGVTFPSEGMGKLKPVEVRGSKAILLIDHFSTAAVFTSEDSMVDLLVRCEESAEGQMLERNEYFESPIIQHRIRSGVDDDGEEYETFEFLETTGDPKGPHGKIWTYIDKDGREYSRIRQYNSDGSLSFALDQIDGQDVEPSELDSIFTTDFATRGAPPEPDEVAAALKRLREKICGEEKECECTAVASVSVSPNHWELEVGEHILLELEVRDAEGNLLEGYDVYWGSSDENVARVDEFGMVTGVGGGLANVGAWVCGEWYLAFIEVGQAAQPVKVIPEVNEIKACQRLIMVAEVRGVDGKLLEASNVVWSSNSEAIAMVVDYGGGTAVVTGLAQGTAIITATVSGQSGSAIVTVNTNPEFPLYTRIWDGTWEGEFYVPSQYPQCVKNEVKLVVAYDSANNEFILDFSGEWQYGHTGEGAFGSGSTRVKGPEPDDPCPWKRALSDDDEEWDVGTWTEVDPSVSSISEGPLKLYIVVGAYRHSRIEEAPGENVICGWVKTPTYYEPFTLYRVGD